MNFSRIKQTGMEKTTRSRSPQPRPATTAAAPLRPSESPLRSRTGRTRPERRPECRPELRTKVRRGFHRMFGRDRGRAGAGQGPDWSRTAKVGLGPERKDQESAGVCPAHITRRPPARHSMCSGNSAPFCPSTSVGSLIDERMSIRCARRWRTIFGLPPAR